MNKIRLVDYCIVTLFDYYDIYIKEKYNSNPKVYRFNMTFDDINSDPYIKNLYVNACCPGIKYNYLDIVLEKRGLI